MKKFIKQEILELCGQVTLGEISFSRMVEVLNERMSEANEPQYKDGDFVVNEAGSILIFKEKFGDFIYDHAYLSCFDVVPNSAPTDCMRSSVMPQQKNRSCSMRLQKRGRDGTQKRNALRIYRSASSKKVIRFG